MNRISRHFLAVLATCVMGVPTANLSAAAFSDENWSSMGNILNDGPLPRLTGRVSAVATDGFGNVDIGGVFTIAGGVFATNIAKWNGSSWSALGSGMDGIVYTLAVSGSDLYAGGGFLHAGDVSATNIARWDGAGWSALGSGLSGPRGTIGVSPADSHAGNHGTSDWGRI